MAQAAFQVIKSGNDNQLRPARPRLVSGGGGGPTKAKLARAFGDLEGPLLNLNCMATLAVDAIDRTICPDAQEVAGRPECFYIPREKAEALVFAVHHLAKMVHDFHGAYHAERAPAGGQ